MTQKITRKDLNALYNSNICDTWKKQIESHLVTQQLNDKITVDNSLILKAYKEADATQKADLEKYFKIETPKTFFDKIKTVDDLFKLTGKKKEVIIPWKKPITKEQKSQNAFATIQVMTEAYNDKTVLNFNDSSQPKWYIWWEKRSGLWVVNVIHNHYYNANMGSGCYFATKEAAQDASVKFKDVFIDYLPE